MLYPLPLGDEIYLHCYFGNSFAIANIHIEINQMSIIAVLAISPQFMKYISDLINENIKYNSKNVATAYLVYINTLLLLLFFRFFILIAHFYRFV